jgi:thiamine biosynthesis lipoprotein
MFHRLNFHAMGSDVLVVLDSQSDQASQSLSQIPEYFEDWEQSLSRFRADSELSRLNRTVDQPMPVSATLWYVFETSQWAEQFTNGLVTPTVLDAMLELGYDQSFDSLPRYQHQSFMLSPVMTQSLTVVVADKGDQTICLPQGVHLDFGGIAKGWAAHQAVESLKVEAPALVNAGGDIAISGPCSNGTAWEIKVKNPFDKDSDFEVLYVMCGGVATSGKDRRRWIQNDQLRHHIIDPMTGLPAVTDLMSATVIAPNVMEAEASAKAVIILGAEDGLAWIEAHEELAGLLVLENGEAWYSKRMKEYL